MSIEQSPIDSGSDHNPIINNLDSRENYIMNNSNSIRTLKPKHFTSKSDSSDSENRSVSKRHKKIACTECRQQKAKCDSFDKSPDPCTRCEKRGVPCRLDSDFKRTFKRAKIAQIVKDYEMMKTKLQTDPSSNKATTTMNQTGQFSTLPPITNISRMTSNFPLNGSTTANPLLNPNVMITNNNSYSPATVMQYSIRHNSLQNEQSIPNSPNSGAKSQTPPFNLPSRSLTPIPADLTASNAFPYSLQMSSNPVALPQLHQVNSNNNSINTLLSAANAANGIDASFKYGPSVIRDKKNDSQFFSMKIPPPEPVMKPILNPAMLECTPKTLGEVTLTEEQIIILFSAFVKYYHPLLPVVDVDRGIERIYRLCPILFWTIMFIALRGHRQLEKILKEESESLYFTLSPILKSALAEITISPITRYAPTEVEEPILNVSSVYSVQAFLLYTFWPPLTSSLSADSSWNTIGIAYYQAIRIGLHLPGHSSDGLKSKDLLKEQVRTWITCNIVSQTIATAFGFPGFVQSHASLLMSCRPENGFEIPTTLRQMLEIQLFEDQVANTLNNNSFDPLMLVDATEKLPMLELLNNELDQLELRLCSDVSYPMDDFRKLALFASRLHLLTYHFLDTERVAKFELEKGLVKAYNSSLTLISHCKLSQHRDEQFVHNLPNVYILTIWQASCIIARLIHSPYANLLDIGTGKDLYQFAIKLALKSSMIKHDLSYRSSGIMRSTWSLFKTLKEQNSLLPKVTVRSRMCASVFFDSLWIVREKCGMIKLGPRRRDKKRISVGSSAESIESDVSDVAIDDESNEKDEKFGNEVENGKSNKENNVMKEGNDGRSYSKESSVSSKKKSNYHPESAARKIINTIPLDPQPIALSETPNDVISNSSSKQSSPFLHNYISPNNDSKKHKAAPQHLVSSLEMINESGLTDNSNKTFVKREEINVPTATTTDTTTDTTTATFMPKIYAAKKIDNENKNVNSESPNLLLDSWDLANEFDSDVLFKDIDSVMNDFGFHAD